MTLFWTLCAVMLLVAMVFIALPLWQKSAFNNDVLRDAANLEILRDQSAEMEVDLKSGLLTQEAYEQGKRELQGRLIEEVKITDQPASISRDPAKILAIILVVALPIFTVMLYHKIGKPEAMLPGATTDVVDTNALITTEEGLRDLESELEDNPENPQGWYRLASSYIEMGRFSEAEKAYSQLVKQVPDEAQIWSNYADVYAMAHGKSLVSAEVAGFLAKALELDPNNTTALALSGQAAMNRQDYVEAITKWQQTITQIEPGSPAAQRFEAQIQEARDALAAQPDGKAKLAQLSAASQPSADNATSVTGVVTLSPKLIDKVSPDDIVFVLARAAQGPKMPLAVLKKQVKDFPLQFTLDDSMAMQPQLKLSGFDSVVVVARVSKSGSPMAQPGDFEGITGVIKPGEKGLKVEIGTVIP